MANDNVPRLDGVQEIMGKLLEQLAKEVQHRQEAYLRRLPTDSPTKNAQDIRMLASAIQQIATVNRW